MELLSNQVVDSFPSRIDGEINGFAWGLEVNNGVRERAPALFWCAEVGKKRAGWLLLERKGKGMYTPSPQWSL